MPERAGVVTPREATIERMTHIDGQMVCPDCGSSSYLIVDGKEMTQYELLHLAHAPKKIERRLPHAVWCTSDDNRMRIAEQEHRRRG